MVLADSIKKAKEISLKQLVEKNPEHINYLLDALELLMYENELLRKIASRYSHDLRSPVTNIDMLLQLYEKAGTNPDKELYINKMIKSIKRLQEGFEELSAERKNLLVKQEGIQFTFLDEVMGEVRAKLSKNIALTTNFTEGKKVKCNAKTLYECIVLLVEPFAEREGIYTVEINSEKSWNGLILNIIYPEFLNLLNEEEELVSPTVYKNALLSNQVLGWNYYFAALFLRTMGSTVTVNESKGDKSIIQISFPQ
jgi:K+-sensing histidine kinase KdpD